MKRKPALVRKAARPKSCAEKTSIERLLVGCGALLEGHFLLSSGLHSGRYLQCALLMTDPGRATRIGQDLAALQGLHPDVVISPAIGGIVVGQEVARAFKARALFAERENEVMTLRRGFRIEPGERVVVVEDVVTTGASTKEVITMAKSRGAHVLGALAVAVRSMQDIDLGVPLRCLLRLPIAAYQAQDCPLCRAGAPLVKPGSRDFRRLQIQRAPTPRPERPRPPLPALGVPSAGVPLRSKREGGLPKRAKKGLPA
ncbi:MAG: orotate phosphoribosyltransferase [Elusimicrobia bacterium]|nr:orotate phosphoribosyltransferase [Elusimicrobiota bacterium]